MEIQRTQWPCSIVIIHIELAEGVCVFGKPKIADGSVQKMVGDTDSKMATSKDDMLYKMTINHWSCCIFFNKSISMVGDRVKFQSVPGVSQNAKKRA